MGVRYEDDCAGCGKPCIGDLCRYKKKAIYFCDECLDDLNPIKLYHYEDAELCASCLLGHFDTVR